MNIRIIIIVFLMSFSLLVAQKTYHVTKTNNGNFKTITEVNKNMNVFSPGDKILFHRGEIFDDSPLIITKSGTSENPIVFGAYGEGNKPIIGNSSAKVNSSIRISKSNIPAGVYGEKVNYIILENFKIIAGAKQNSNSRTVQIKGDHNIIRYCEIVGNSNSTTDGARGISIEQGSTASTVTHNEISYFDRGIRIFQPLNTDISYNYVHHIYRNNGIANKGGNCVVLAKDGNKKWDCKYSVNIHNNVFSDFEHSAMWVGLMSNLIIEKNIIENPLDETVYRGGVHHGGVGKLFDNTGEKLGNTGIIFRYNVVRNLGRVGLPNYTYDIDGTIINTNNGYGRPVYKAAREDRITDFGIRSQDQANNTIGGLGYANIWIHNNLFYNIHNRVFNRGYTHYYKDTNLGGCTSIGSNCEKGVYRSDLPSYFFNNTLYNIGYSSYITNDNGIVTSELDAQSPTIVKNNIFYIGNSSKNSYAIRFRENGEVSNNLFLNRKGETEVEWDGPDPPENTAIYWRGGDNLSSKKTELFSTDPKFNNKNGKIFLSNIGINGVTVPDFRLLNETSPAYNAGANVGNDPSGVDLSIDIQGNQRNVNTIGAFSIASLNNNHDNNTDSTSTQFRTPTITQQPTNQNTTIGQTITLSVVVTCDDPVGYQWWKTPFVSIEESKITNNSKYSGATTNTLTIKNVDESDNGLKYVCEIYNTKDHSNHWINSQPAFLSITTTKKNFSNLHSKVKIYLEGAFQNGTMSTILVQKGYLPKNQPFNNSNYNFTAFQKVSIFPSTIVDWVLVELRSDLTTKVKRFAALLNSDGNLLNLDGSNDFSNQKISDGKYYLVIHHRNHLPVMSSSKISINNSIINYDFTTNMNRAYGSNSMVKLPNGKFAMLAGDANGNKKINVKDYDIIKANIFSTGYLNGDIDMNGVINILDYSKINQNINTKSQVP